MSKFEKAEKYPVHLSIFLTYDMNLRLEEYCRREDRSKSSAMRHAIRLMLEEEDY